MSFEFPSIKQVEQEKTQEPVPEYTSFIDRTLISIGDKTIKYWPFIVMGAIVIILLLMIVIWGFITVRAVGERFNQLDIRHQERSILEEQLLDQPLSPLSSEENGASTHLNFTEEVDQSRWFKVLEDNAETELDDAFYEETDSKTSRLKAEELTLQMPHPTKLLITQDGMWHLHCNGRGLSESGPGSGLEECVLQTPRPLPTEDLATTSN